MNGWMDAISVVERFAHRMQRAYQLPRVCVCTTKQSGDIGNDGCGGAQEYAALQYTVVYLCGAIHQNSCGCAGNKQQSTERTLLYTTPWHRVHQKAIDLRQ